MMDLKVGSWIGDVFFFTLLLFVMEVFFCDFREMNKTNENL